MTPPALLGEVWRTVLDGRDVVIVRYIVPHAVEWRDGEWHRMWDEDAAGVFRAWGEAMAAERDAARGVAQLAVEEAAALRKQLARAQDELDAYRAVAAGGETR